MLDFIWGLIGLSVKVLAVALAINVLILILKGGRETMRDVRETILMGFKVGIQKLQVWLSRKYRGS
jgi:hypothetical protein